jgi:hypothetical protein
MDKALKSRVAKGEGLENVVMLFPKAAFVAKLPKMQITSREDFKSFGEDQEGRAKYWTEVSEQSEILAEELHQLIQSGQFAEHITDF